MKQAQAQARGKRRRFPRRHGFCESLGTTKLCPKIVCYKWHLVTQRAKLPRAATIDLAQLRLAPSLREATENGQVDLIINAVERRKGRENVIFVATSLFGVMPHDETP